MALAGRIGADLDLAAMPHLDCPLPEQRMYSESASRFVVTVKPEHAADFEALFAGDFMASIGTTTESGRLILRDAQQVLVDMDVEKLALCWKKTLDF